MKINLGLLKKCGEVAVENVAEEVVENVVEDAAEKVAKKSLITLRDCIAGGIGGALVGGCFYVKNKVEKLCENVKKKRPKKNVKDANEKVISKIKKDTKNENKN